MKRLLIFFLALTVILYAMPIFTLGFGRDDTEQAQAPQLPEEDRTVGEAVLVGETESYDRATRVTVCIGGKASDMTIHDYLCGVVAAEMPASFPEEALKAQAVAARTYTLYKIKLYESGTPTPESHNGAQLCDDPTHCKGFCDLAAKEKELWGASAEKYRAIIEESVTSTDGIIATYGGEPIAAVFHAASGARTESAIDVWGGNAPYLQSVPSEGGEASANFHASVSVTADRFRALFLAKYPKADLSGLPATWFRDSARSEAGGVINMLVGGVRVQGTEIRTMFGLNSTNFKLKTTETSLTFETTGYGHGVGMSQFGARAMALEGKTYEEIIKSYYTGVELTLKN